MNSAKRILIAPLDWGLGHATRCIPIIEALLQAGHQPILGGAGGALALLQKRFPDLPFIELPAYNIHYGKGGNLVGSILRQLPRLIKVIRKEHLQLAELVTQKSIDGCISDNRYGLFHHSIPCVMVCHQLAPIPPWGWGWARRFAMKLHRKFLVKFDEIWIPDAPGEDSLAGTLADSYAWAGKTSFIGTLSRFDLHPPIPESFSIPSLNTDEIGPVAILSGPEPQRTILEKMLVDQAKAEGIPLCLVAGKPEMTTFEQIGCVKWISFLEGEDLRLMLMRASVVISRSGYSSLMDYQALGLKQVILIPTLGQTEQVYLAKRLEAKGVAPQYKQNSFDLGKALREVKAYKGFVDSKKTDQKQLPHTIFSLFDSK